MRMLFRSFQGKQTLLRMHRCPGLLTRITAVAGVGLLAACTMAIAMRTAGVTVHASSRADGDKKAGAGLFHASGCEFCHGADGRGTDRGPDLGTVGRRLTRQQIERQIQDGGGGMPAFGDALQPEQILDLVAFLHERKKAPAKQKDKDAAPPTSNRPPAKSTSEDP